MGMEGLIIALLVLVAAMVGLRFGVAVALFEITVGAVAANYLAFTAPVWLPTFAEIGSLLLIFLAGSDVDVAFLRRRLGPVLLVGSASFLAPFLAMLAVGYLFMDWPAPSRLLIAIASSSTSVAIVYPVLRDGGLLEYGLGKLLLLIAFLPDFLITLALFAFFTPVTGETALMMLVLVAAVIVLHYASLRFLRRYGETSSEVKIRFIFAVLLALAFLSEKGHLHASLAVFILGILVSELMKEQEETERRVRALSFGIFVPMFYFRAGLNFSVAAVVDHWALIALTVAVAFVSKFVAVYFLSRRWLGPNTRYGSFLMNARLTFGTIASTFGLSHGIIDRGQFSVLISMIFLSSAIALVFCGKPRLDEEAESRQPASEGAASLEKLESAG